MRVIPTRPLLALVAVLLPLATAAHAVDPHSSNGVPAAPPTANTAPASSSAAPDFPLYGNPVPISGQTSAFHDSVAGRYAYPWGKSNPFLPSNATVANGQFLNPKEVPTAEYCGHCHKEAYHQWRESIHANAFRVPWYENTVNMLIDEKGVHYSRHCEGCHNPIALFSGDLSKGMPKVRPFREEGVTCMTCHAIQSVNTTGTGSYVLGTPAVMVDENGRPITGNVPDSEILAHLDRHSKAVMRDFYRSAEFCASCHKAAIPRILNDYKWLRAFSVYDEWQAASFTKQSPLPFYRKDVVSTCQACHMMREPLGTAVDPGAKKDQLASHRFLGGNTLLPAYYNYPEQAEKLRKFLHEGFDGKGVLNVDIFALEKESAAATPNDHVLIAPLGLTSFALAPSDTLIATVVIQNKGIAHTLVPEQRDFYEAWVNFSAKDEAGKTIAESGFLQPDGSLDPSAHSFTNRLISDDASHLAEHQIWHTRIQAYNNTIQSGRSQLARYRFRLPKDAHGRITLTATVKYRRFNQHFVDFIMKDDPGFKKPYPQPVIEMASQTRVFQIGENAPVAPAPEENKEWMRWNNYGIGLLDALQYKDSVAAFERVAALRPDYADAFTNMAVVEIAWERYEDAKTNLAKALAILPADPRALYYRAIATRNAGNISAAIADLEAVVAAYPRSKDGLRELGFSYYQAHEYPKARAMYERLQAIDPDDLAAHYQLAILYRRTGEKEKAAIESAKFADQKDDPTVSNLALDFLGKHPEVASESVVWHTHDLTGDPVKIPAKLEYKYIPGAGL